MLERIDHVVTQQAAQWGQQLSKALEINLSRTAGGNERLPQEEIAQQSFDSGHLLRRGSLAAVSCNIARQTNYPAHTLAIPVERPFIAVGVEDIRDSPEAPELIAVMVTETAGSGTDAECLEFNIADQRLIAMNGIIRTTEAAGQGCFACADDIPTKSLGSSSHKGLERGAQLVFW